ncbi:MAG: HK97 family phage prohead protease [Bacteroidia bacterium]|jgi:hypothetical protein
MRELRYTVEPVECRADEEGKEYIIGRAIVYGKPYKMWEGRYEFIAQNALEGCDMSDVIASFNHEDHLLLGRSVNGEGTLRIIMDDGGCRFEIPVNETTASKDCHTNVKLKNVRGCSFEFTPAEVDWQYDVPQADGTKADIRTIVKIGKLYAVNPVVYPAYRDTDIETMKRSIVAPDNPAKINELEMLELEYQLINR